VIYSHNTKTTIPRW